jgi:hypothetical protein
VTYEINAHFEMFENSSKNCFGYICVSVTSEMLQAAHSIFFSLNFDLPQTRCPWYWA